MDPLYNNRSSDEKLRQAHREINMLYEVSAAMRTTLELEHILYIILTGVTSHAGLGFNRAILFLVNPRTRALECEMVIGPESGEHASKIWNYIETSQPKLDDLIQEDKVETTVAHSTLFRELKKLSFPLNTEQRLLLIDAYRRAQPWLLPPQELANYHNDPLLQHFKTNEVLIMPLRAKGNINGLIVADNLYTQKPITDDDIRIFTMLAGQAGLAIENSRLYELTVLKSRTDSLTNLLNHGAFQEKLQDAIASAKKHHQPLSLLMIDIDHFKVLNDTHGHQVGDAVLTQLADLLRESARPQDHIGRYGGEEFAVIFTSTDKPRGIELAQQIRRRIEEHAFKTPADTALSVTVSIGVAAFAQDAQTKEDLITGADKAMYIAKFTGRNRIYPAEDSHSKGI